MPGKVVKVHVMQEQQLAKPWTYMYVHTKRQAGESLGLVLKETLSSACIDVNGARSSVKFEEFRNDRNQPRMIYDDRGAFIW